MLRCLVPLLLVLTACSGTARVVRVDPDEGEPIVFTPRVRGEPIKLDEREVRKTLAQLGREMRPPANPQQAARQLLELGVRSGWYEYEPHRHRIIPTGRGAHLEEERSASEVEITRSYLNMCESQRTPGDCMRLLMESPVITGDGRYALAMSFAKGAVWDEMKEAFKDMANPEAVMTAVLWTGTTYLLLLSEARMEASR